MILDQVYNQSHAEKPQKASYEKDASSEKPLRSIVKSISWRVVGTIDTVLISWVITGTLSLAFSIGRRTSNGPHEGQINSYIGTCLRLGGCPAQRFRLGY